MTATLTFSDAYRRCYGIGRAKSKCEVKKKKKRNLRFW
jgi:hypothetical protein